MFNKGKEHDRVKNLKRLYTLLKIYSPRFEHDQLFYVFEKTERMKGENLDSDSDDETVIIQSLQIQLLRVDLTHKELVYVDEPNVKQHKAMEKIIDNLYKRIPLYLVMQKVPEVLFTPLLENHFVTRHAFETSREPIDTQGLDFQYVEKIRLSMNKGRAKLFKEKQLWHFLTSMLNLLK